MTRPAHRDLKHEFDMLVLWTVLNTVSSTFTLTGWSLGWISETPTGHFLVIFAAFNLAYTALGLAGLYHRVQRGDLEI